MANEKKVRVNLIDIYPVIKDKIENGGNVQLPITGISMRPLLKAGRDTVELVKCKDAKKGDIIFYLRDNGQFVLHRIVGTDEKGYVLCGDNQWYLEKGINDEHIIAVVKSITRKGKLIEVTSLTYKAYSNLWMAILPVRKFIIPFIRKLKTFIYNICVKVGIIEK